MSETPSISPDWILDLVRLANLWQAEEIRFQFKPGRLRVEIPAVGEDSEWFRQLLDGFQQKQEPERDEQTLLWRALSEALKQAGGVLLTSGSQSFSLSEEGYAAAQTPGVARGSFLLEFSNLERPVSQELERHLGLYSCSDRTVVRCGADLTAFLPLSRRQVEGRQEQGLEVETPLAIWAFPCAESGIPLGRTMAGLPCDAIRRNELNFGCFRSGCLGPESGLREQAASVLTFSYHNSKTPGRVVWLHQGVEVAHQDLALAERRLAPTVYLPLPEVEWRGEQFLWSGELVERLDRGCGRLQEGLKVLVEEYNRYRPSLSLRTVGCWSAILLSFLALAGLLAPTLGTKWAVIAGLTLAVLGMVAEFRGRQGLRKSIGSELQALADELASTPEEQRLWRPQLYTPTGAPFISDSP